MPIKNCLVPPLILFAVLLATACVPVSTVPAAQPDEATVVPPVAVEPSATSFPPVELTATHDAADSLLSATPPVDAQPIATSRGPNLEATDPATVSLASGGIQFVEFFRFT